MFAPFGRREFTSSEEGDEDGTGGRTFCLMLNNRASGRFDRSIVADFSTLCSMTKLTDGRGRRERFKMEDRKRGNDDRRENRSAKMEARRFPTHNEKRIGKIIYILL